MRDDPLQLSISGFTPWRIQRWTSHGCSGTRETENMLGMDPALALQTLRVCNSPLLGLKGKVSTLPHAIALLGSDPLKGLILGSMLREKAPDAPKLVMPEDSTHFWAHSIHVASVARILADQTGYDLPEEAYVAGLLHDSGKRLATGEAPRSGAADHARRGGAMARRWHLPRGITGSITHHHAAPGRIARLAKKTRWLIAITAAADFLCHQSMGARNGKHHSGTEFLAEMGIGEEERSEACRRAEQAILERLGADGLAFDSMEQMYREASKAKDLELDSDLFEGSEESLSSTLHFINQATRDIRHKSSSDEVVDSILKLLHRNLGYDRVAYLSRNRGGRTLSITRLLDGTNFSPDQDAPRLQLGKGEKSMTAALKELQCSLARDLKEDGTLLAHFGVPEVGIAPVMVHKQAVGVLTIDQFARGTPLDERDLTTLELLAGKLGMLIENLKLASQRSQLKKIAEKDPLTGINNRRFCIDLCRKEIDRARRYAAPLSIVLLDIDNFKALNDGYGHPVGDRVLRELARLIAGNSRSTDIIGRFGGDEFLVILPQISRDPAITYAERLRTCVAEMGRSLRKKYPRSNLAISVGVATWRKGDRMDDVISAADKALYAAKERGRNRVCTTE